MNERIIWDFVSKAREFAVSDTPDGGKCFDQDVFHNKFAELIVDAVYDHILDATMYDEPFPFREDVRKHFGVE
jgi:hypothetical protein